MVKSSSILLLLTLVTFCSAQGGDKIVSPKAQPLDQQNIADQCSKPVGGCDAKNIYRTYDGSCNNLKTTYWGMSSTGHVRLLPPNYADGKSQHRVSIVDKSELPSARLLSTLLFKQKPLADIHTRAFLTFSQIVAHDITSNPESPGGKCCTAAGDGLAQPQAPYCRPISVPDNDTYYNTFGRKCLEYRQSFPIQGCPLNDKVLQPIMLSTHYIDASVLYGSDEKKAMSLRTKQGGKIVVVEKGGVSYLPPFQDLPVATSKSECPLDSANCFDSGDPRVNQNLDLVATTLALYKFHNYLVEQLATIKTGASDEELYQTGRRIMGAVLQNIMYSEILPELLGREYVSQHGLIPENNAFFQGYDPNMNPTTLADLVASAFRSLHTLIPSKIDFVKEDRTVSRSIPFSAGLHNPGPVFTVKESYAELLRGQATQLEEKADNFITEEITNKFYDIDVPNVQAHKFGDDLIARDIQRGRDFGLGVYNDYRELCGLARAKTFEDLKEFDPAMITALKGVYKSVDDIDYYVGAFAERFVPGGLVTPSFRCVIAESFSRYKKADRFYFTTGGQPGSLTLEQIKTIKSISLGAIYCGGSDIAQMQPNIFRPAGGTNKLTPCPELLKAIDLTTFK